MTIEKGHGKVGSFAHFAQTPHGNLLQQSLHDLRILVSTQCVLESRIVHEVRPDGVNGGVLVCNRQCGTAAHHVGSRFHGAAAHEAAVRLLARAAGLHDDLTAVMVIQNLCQFNS